MTRYLGFRHVIKISTDAFPNSFKLGYYNKKGELSFIYCDSDLTVEENKIKLKRYGKKCVLLSVLLCFFFLFIMLIYKDILVFLIDIPYLIFLPIFCCFPVFLCGVVFCRFSKMKYFKA